LREPCPALRGIHGNEFHITIHQVRDESNVACEPIEAGNQEDGAAFAAFCERCEQLRALCVALSAFDFDELRNDLSAVLDISTDGFALRVYSQPGGALLVGGHA
jgi:hypothetical protein